MDFQLTEANWPQLSPSETTWKKQVPTSSRAWDLCFGGLTSQYRKGENKTQNPLIYTQQAPPLPLAEGTHQPPPAPVSPTPWTQGPGPAPAGLEVAWESQVADSHLRLRPSPAHLGHRLRKQPCSLPRRRGVGQLPLGRAAETPGAKLQRAAETSGVMTSWRRQPMKRRTEEAGLGLNLLVEFESPGSWYRSEQWRYPLWACGGREVLVEKTGLRTLLSMTRFAGCWGVPPPHV